MGAGAGPLSAAAFSWGTWCLAKDLTWTFPLLPRDGRMMFRAERRKQVRTWLPHCPNQGSAGFSPAGSLGLSFAGAPFLLATCGKCGATAARPQLGLLQGGRRVEQELEAGQRLGCASPLAVSRGYSTGRRYHKASLPCLLSIVSSSCFAPAPTWSIPS